MPRASMGSSSWKNGALINRRQCQAGSAALWSLRILHPRVAAAATWAVRARMAVVDVRVAFSSSCELWHNRDSMPRRAGQFDRILHQGKFLAAFAECGIINWAARWAKVHRTSHYVWMNEDPTYPERFKEAERQAARGLVDEATRRGRFGVKKPVWYKGKIVGYETEFSDRMLELVIKGEFPNKYKEPTPDVEATPIQIQAMKAALLDAIKDIEPAVRIQIAERLMLTDGTRR